MASSSITIPAAPQTASLGLVSSTTVFLGPPIHLYLHCQFPKFYCPLFAPPHPTHPHPPLLFLQAPHYPLSAFPTHSPISHCLFYVISFFFNPDISFCQLQTSTFFFFDLNETPYSTSSTDVLNGSKFVSKRLLSLSGAHLYCFTRVLLKFIMSYWIGNHNFVKLT